MMHRRVVDAPVPSLWEHLYRYSVEDRNYSCLYQTLIAGMRNLYCGKYKIFGARACLYSVASLSPVAVSVRVPDLRLPPFLFRDVPSVRVVPTIERRRWGKLERSCARCRAGTFSRRPKRPEFLLRAQQHRKFVVQFASATGNNCIAVELVRRTVIMCHFAPGFLHE